MSVGHNYRANELGQWIITFQELVIDRTGFIFQIKPFCFGYDMHVHKLPGGNLYIANTVCNFGEKLQRNVLKIHF